MIFSRHNGVDLYAKMMDGTKTQTRRPALVTDVTDGNAVYRMTRRGRRRMHWHLDQMFAIQPTRGKRSGGRRLIVAIDYVPRVGDISEEDARAEGFPDAAAFCAGWEGMYGAGSLEWPAWVLTFAPGAAIVEEEK